MVWRVCWPYHLSHILTAHRCITYTRDGHKQTGLLGSHAVLSASGFVAYRSFVAIIWSISSPPHTPTKNLVRNPRTPLAVAKEPLMAPCSRRTTHPVVRNLLPQPSSITRRHCDLTHHRCPKPLPSPFFLVSTTPHREKCRADPYSLEVPSGTVQLREEGVPSARMPGQQTTRQLPELMGSLLNQCSAGEATLSPCRSQLLHVFRVSRIALGFFAPP
ncbi:hypothetical protein BD289DRAFT_75082 [Coniella lustricola]|uniref:Uncharacterized protein n=1 Tax=Coniella lustricola TaxID=2025994 RepID=A0A2T3AHR2_9PEZI|nr:hypothetical protein BD289DRAFT_75082 [Coniella lustricola]